MRDRSILKVQERVNNEEWTFAFLHDLSLDEQGRISVWLSNLTMSDSTVLSMSPEDILNKACVALLFDDSTGKVISSASMMKPQKNSFNQWLGEIGSMFTVEEYQRHGAASYLVHRIDEWAKKQDGIDGAYAFLNSKSPRSFAVNNYKSTVHTCNKSLNAAEVAPQYAFNLCRTICKDEHAIYLMDLEIKKKHLENKKILTLKEEQELQDIYFELSREFEDRKHRFKLEINKLHSKIRETRKRKDISYREIKYIIGYVYRRIIQFYRGNLENNLHCCDVIVAKIY